jgi:hypothetical protein
MRIAKSSTQLAIWNQPETNFIRNKDDPAAEFLDEASESSRFERPFLLRKKYI